VESRAKGAEEAQEDGSHHVTMPQVRRDRRQFSAIGAWPTPPPSATVATRIGFWLGTARTVQHVGREGRPKMTRRGSDKL
jgi:hypothetical protein